MKKNNFEYVGKCENGINVYKMGDKYYHYFYDNVSLIGDGKKLITGKWDGENSHAYDKKFIFFNGESIVEKSENNQINNKKDFGKDVNIFLVLIVLMIVFFIFYEIAVISPLITGIFELIFFVLLINRCIKITIYHNL